MEKEIIYAPVVIPTLCRYEHFVRCIESLKNNTWAKFTDVYIALDYPKHEGHRAGYDKIDAYLKSGDFEVFSSFTVVRRECNYGMGKNGRILLQDIVSKKYDRWIFAEDDIEFCPVFLEYMDKCLSVYENDDSVLAVNGYAYPIGWKLDNGANAFLQDATFSTWGVGYWRDKYWKARQELQNGYLRDNFKTAKRAGLLKEMVRGRYYDYMHFILSGSVDKLYYGASDVAFSIYIKLKGQYVITPAITKTRNLGFDGSGQYCTNIKEKSNKHSQSYDYLNQTIDNSLEFRLHMDTGKHLPYNREKLDRFLYVSRQQRLRCAILRPIYAIAGPNMTRKLISFAKRVIKGKISNEI